MAHRQKRGAKKQTISQVRMSSTTRDSLHACGRLALATATEAFRRPAPSDAHASTAPLTPQANRPMAERQTHAPARAATTGCVAVGGGGKSGTLSVHLSGPPGAGAGAPASSVAFVQ